MERSTLFFVDLKEVLHRCESRQALVFPLWQIRYLFLAIWSYFRTSATNFVVFGLSISLIILFYRCFDPKSWKVDILVLKLFQTVEKIFERQRRFSRSLWGPH